MDHPETARSYHNIGCTYFSLHEMEKALENFNKAYFIRKKLLGEENKDTIRSRSEIETVKRKINSKNINNV
jgi:nephrocystin-3